MDFTSQDFFRDPTAELERLRARGPVAKVKLPIIGRVWATTTQEMASRVLKDPQVFTMRRDGGAVAGERWWMPGIFRAFARNMLTIDEPDHTRLRGIVDEAFRRRAVLDMKPHIDAIADEFARDLFAQGSPADLVTRYARTLPLSVICELLGLPLAERPKFGALAGRVTDLSSPLGFLRMVPSLAALKRYLEQHLEHASERGGVGLTAALVQVEKEGAQISRDEMVMMLLLLLVAGHETTAHLISGSVFELAKNPGLRDWLAEDWSRVDLALEEFLRFVCPVQFSEPRFVRQDMDLGNAHLKRGDRIVATLVAANRDPAANVSPDKLDLERRPNHHLAFGTGVHFCLGHQLARLEGRCALEALYTQWPGLTLAVRPAQIRWRSRAGIRAIASLPVVADRCA